MILEIPLKEIEVFLSNHYNVKVGLKNNEENKMEVDYFVSLILTIIEVKENKVFFKYHVNGFLNLLAESVHYFMGNKLGNIPVEWNSETNEVIVNLNNIKALSGFLNLFYLSELRFVDENIILVIQEKLK